MSETSVKIQRDKGVFAAKTDLSWVREDIDEAVCFLWDVQGRIPGSGDLGKTIRKLVKCNDGKERTVWGHVFRNDLRTSNELRQVFSSLDRFLAEWKGKAAVTSSEAQK